MANDKTFRSVCHNHVEVNRGMAYNQIPAVEIEVKQTELSPHSTAIVLSREAVFSLLEQLVKIAKHL